MIFRSNGSNKLPALQRIYNSSTIDKSTFSSQNALLYNITKDTYIFIRGMRYWNAKLLPKFGGNNYYILVEKPVCVDWIFLYGCSN